jgi:GDP-D-mannose dehydratase
VPRSTRWIATSELAAHPHACTSLNGPEATGPATGTGAVQLVEKRRTTGLPAGPSRGGGSETLGITSLPPNADTPPSSPTPGSAARADVRSHAAGPVARPGSGDPTW